MNDDTPRAQRQIAAALSALTLSLGLAISPQIAGAVPGVGKFARLPSAEKPQPHVARCVTHHHHRTCHPAPRGPGHRR